MAAPSPRTWFITGTSSGFGRVFTEAALERGDRVVATARNPATLDDLVAQYPDTLRAVALDVTDRAQVGEAIATAVDAFGKLDIVVNNAGYGHFGVIEDVTEEEARAQIETNVFGALWVTQAALPHLREQGSGHIIQISSIGGVAAFPGLGLYHASKWALEGFSEALSREVKGFGVRVTNVEPSGFRTKWNNASSVHSEPSEPYAPIYARFEGMNQNSVAGDPVRAAAALLQLVDQDDPPLRLLMGNMAYDTALRTYDQRIETWKAWEQVSRETDFPDGE